MRRSCERCGVDVITTVQFYSWFCDPCLDQHLYEMSERHLNQLMELEPPISPADEAKIEETIRLVEKYRERCR